MDDDDSLMIIGAKKTKEIKNDDKNDLNTCVQNFKKYALSEGDKSVNVNKDLLVNICHFGEVDKNYIRPIIWKTFLNVLPLQTTLEDWVGIVTKQRSSYKSKVKNLNALKKFSGDPLGGSNDSGWNSFFEENELKKIINLDVNRTYQDKDLFQNTVIKEILVNILFIWSKENRDVSYKQGMNELLAVILFGIYPFYFTSSNKPTKETIIQYVNSDSLREKQAKEIYLYFHDQDELASDLYYMFDAVMNKGIKELFDSGMGKKRDISNYKKFDLFQPQWAEEDDHEKDQLPLQRRCYLIIKEKLKVIDEELYNHFIKIDLNCAIFLQRWLKCIFNREFHHRDVIVLWDAIIANDLSDTLSLAANESYSFMFIDFIAVAMINYIREDLLRKDQNDCFQRLFKYPPIESPVTLIKLANQIKDLLFKNKKKKEQIKINNSVKNKNILQQDENRSGTGGNIKHKVNGNNSTVSNNTISGYLNNKEESIIKTESSNKTNKNNIISFNSENDIFSPDVKFNSTNSVNVNNNCSNNDDESYKIITRLEDIYKKYKHIFDQDDSSDFESIIDTLKNNLNSD